MRIVFAGTPEFAAEFLDLLIHSEFEVVGVFTQPDRPAGRGKKLQPSAVKQRALAAKLPVLQPPDFKTPEHRQLLSDLHPDLMVVVAYGLMLPIDILTTPTLGCINVHASLLPRWRGAAPIQRAIEAGDTESGVTIMQMDRGLDTGAMLNRACCPITASDTAASLHDHLIDLGKPLLLETLTQLHRGIALAEAQDNELATYANKIQKAEARLNWHLSAAELNRQIRAFNPFPTAFSEIMGSRVRIQQALALESAAEGSSGQIVNVSENGIDVRCGSGVLRLQTLQMPGKTARSSAEILRGYSHIFASGQQFDV